MAVTRFATLRAAEPLGGDTRLLSFDLHGDEPLGFSGGQYLIVDAGLVLPSGKAVKRAYSILTPDGDQHRFTLASKRIDPGPGSGYMHGLLPGAEIKFSGPWGKLRPDGERPGRVLVLATDTGVTATLGLVLGRAFAPLLPRTHFVWLRPDPGYFLPEALVRERLPAGLEEVAIDLLPPIGHPERVAHVRTRLADDLGRAGSSARRQPVAQAFIAGDGTINYALLDDLVAAGIPATRDHLESFFNMPKKSPAAPPAGATATGAKGEAA